MNSLLMKKLIIIIVSLIVSMPLFSQHSEIKVNGLILGATYTESQITDSLGAPSRITPPNEDFPDWITYWYFDSLAGKENEFTLINNSLEQIVIRGNNIKLNNSLGVGMSTSAVNQMGGIIFNVKPNLFYWAPSEEYKSIGYAIIHFNPSNQKITLIDVSTTSDFM